MDVFNIKCKTWHDVLIEKGFDPSISKALIGFISWNKGEEFNNLDSKINEILCNQVGTVFANEVESSNYNDRGLIFFNVEVSKPIANKIFDAIMNYEQMNVYNPLY